METRRCKQCDTVKDINLFCKDRHNKSQFAYTCKECRNKKAKKWQIENPEKVKAINDRHKENRKEYYNSPERKIKYRSAYIERRFGLKYSDYERMAIEQNNLCAICGKPESGRHKYLSVDHCHDTGKVRQLLCNMCNRFLGWVKEDINTLSNMINYLKKHKNEQ